MNALDSARLLRTQLHCATSSQHPSSLFTPPHLATGLCSSPSRPTLTTPCSFAVACLLQRLRCLRLVRLCGTCCVLPSHRTKAIQRHSSGLSPSSGAGVGLVAVKSPRATCQVCLVYGFIPACVLLLTFLLPLVLGVLLLFAVSTAERMRVAVMSWCKHPRLCPLLTFTRAPSSAICLLRGSSIFLLLLLLLLLLLMVLPELDSLLCT